jgi:Zn-dependent M32 family carboxypeptidase
MKVNRYSLRSGKSFFNVFGLKMEAIMAQSISRSIILLVFLLSGSLLAQENSQTEVDQPSNSEQLEPTQKNSTDIENAMKEWEKVTAQLTKRLDFATSKMNGAIKQAKDSEGYSIKVGDIEIIVDRGNEYYLKLFVFTVLLKEILKQYDENPTQATRKIIANSKQHLTSFAQAVGLMKKPVVKKPWWQF